MAEDHPYPDDGWDMRVQWLHEYAQFKTEHDPSGEYTPFIDHLQFLLGPELQTSLKLPFVDEAGNEYPPLLSSDYINTIPVVKPHLEHLIVLLSEEQPTPRPAEIPTSSMSFGDDNVEDDYHVAYANWREGLLRSVLSSRHLLNSLKWDELEESANRPTFGPAVWSGWSESLQKTLLELHPHWESHDPLVRQVHMINCFPAPPIKISLPSLSLPVVPRMSPPPGYRCATYDQAKVIAPWAGILSQASVDFRSISLIVPLLGFHDEDFDPNGEVTRVYLQGLIMTLCLAKCRRKDQPQHVLSQDASWIDAHDLPVVTATTKEGDNVFLHPQVCDTVIDYFARKLWDDGERQWMVTNATAFIRLDLEQHPLSKAGLKRTYQGRYQRKVERIARLAECNHDDGLLASSPNTVALLNAKREPFCGSIFKEFVAGFMLSSDTLWSYARLFEITPKDNLSKPFLHNAILLFALASRVAADKRDILSDEKLNRNERDLCQEYAEALTPETVYSVSQSVQIRRAMRNVPATRPTYDAAPFSRDGNNSGVVSIPLTPENDCQIIMTAREASSS
ncbi:hypothetical protein Hypma_006978 [Hypsizygus marmoreus]|uniref:Uncharacterized protein n=1 Tax=Hypsizygus marmoreus TaxID=39966 RepID=A0A369JZ92_HYPMA|nr:hypothetical protein Hypma_006978 [Hypsizygus marmoreus]